MNLRRAFIGGGIILLVLVALFTRGFGLLDYDEDGLTLYGNVDIRQVDLAFRVGGRIAEIAPEEGEPVNARTVVARLDERPLQDALDAASAQLAVAKAQNAKIQAGSRPQEIRQTQAQLEEARASLDRAKEDYDRRSELVKTGAVSQQVFDATTAQYQTAQAQVKAARQALSLAREGARKEDRAASVAEVEAARAQRNQAQTNLDDAKLITPNSGTVLTRAREPGAIVQPGETVLTLTIDRPMRLRAYVGAEDLSRISPDMKVTVRADGNDKVYQGRISQISPTAEFTPKTVQTEDLRTDLVYRVRILVDQPDDALRQGQPVTVHVPGARPKAQN
ncbi:HlyD family efflux transporter periplasmic adaptor subunit [Altericroceibacterium spongiae]|uniref:HlyD family efflux transporter periplasmic adaptor subunit n=1 Tax=Altericroceibacterium spongiae TaxID=2320269 RepID=A0A420ECD0_9SPHN|nr:HlyD family efflux transporter periplasmic adaptor subunit [Altericroceibacterium spongiae]RKF18340.1 HlyD family efflux transporter periplasmic adaptor subunit [Altericroceibacterium spongiae]